MAQIHNPDRRMRPGDDSAASRAPSKVVRRMHDRPLARPPTFQHVLSMRAQVREDEAQAFTRKALQEVRSYIEHHNLPVEGPPFVLAHRVSAHRVDVEAGWPTSRARGGGQIHSGAIPASRLRRFERRPT